MNEISNRFCFFTPSEILDALLQGHAVAPGVTTHVFSAVGNILFDQNSSETDGGVVWNQTMRAVTSDPAILQHKDAKLNPAFFMTDGTLRVIGTHYSAPTVSVAPYNGGRFLVQVSFQAPDALIL